MRKWLALGIQLPFVAMVWAGCSGGDEVQGDAGDAQAQDAKIDKKTPPDTGAQDTGTQDSSTTCSPSSTIDTGQLKWVPPITPQPTACSDVQISSFYDACFGPNKSSTACQAFENSSNNTTCLKCLITPQAASAYGALIGINSLDYANTAGCIAILTGDTSNTGCGAKAEAVIECETLACEPNCAQATSSEYSACTSSSLKGVCSSYVSAKCDLSDAGAVYATCLNHPSFASFYAAIAPVFCGGYPADAGAGDAGADAALDAPPDATDN